MSKKIVINTQERAVSSDINRLQSFAVRDAVEALRYRYLLQSGGPELPSTSIAPSTQGTPLFAEILGGLMVRPQAASFNLLIDAGALVMIDPTNAAASVDDSPGVFVKDPGTTVAILANASGSVRIDVVECRLNPTPDIVTDNRDIFDEETGLFSASSVTKEKGDRLEYRVRQGTPGAGYPAAQAGWLPLCVCRVPSGATSVDTCDFWDVRPMVDDWDDMARGYGTVSALKDQNLTCDRVSSSSVILAGTVAGRVGGRKFGGLVQKGTPGTFVADQFDVADASNQDAAITEALTGHVYVYAVRPFGLPRWAYYAPSPAARLPCPGGMLVASYTKARPDAPQASASIVLPASTNLGGSATQGETCCVAVLMREVTTNRFGSFASANKIQNLKTFPASITSAAYTSQFDFAIPDTALPPNAKRFRVRVTFSFTLATGTLMTGTGVLSIYEATQTRIVCKTESAFTSAANHSGSNQTITLYAYFDCTLPDGQDFPYPLKAEVALGAGLVPVVYGTDPTLTTASMQIQRIEL